MNLQPLRILLVAFCLAAALLSALHWQPTSAQPEPDSTTAIGSIQGTVTGPEGAPLADIEVELLRAAVTGEWLSLYTTTTDVRGNYTIEPLTPGAFRLGFRDPSNRYGQQYYSGSVTLAGAAAISINGNRVTGVDAQLAAAGGVSGKVSNRQAPLHAIGIFAQAGEEWQIAKTFTAEEMAQPEEQQGYTALGLPPGIYRVCAYTLTLAATPLTGPCYDRISAGVAWAVDVTVTAGSVVTGIDVTDQGLRDLAAIRGTLRDGKGTRLAGMKATAYQPSGDWQDEWEEQQTAVTDAEGVYELVGLVPDTYLVRFWDSQGAYVAKYYGGGGTPSHAQVIPLGPSEQREGVDDYLSPGGIITGAISFAEQTLPPTATVYAFPAVETLSGAWSYPGDYDPSRGAYRIGGLPPGVYLVGAWASDLVTPYSEYGAFYGDVQDITRATPVTITGGSRIGGVDIHIAQGAFDGAIMGIVSNALGQPLPGIRVELLQTWQDWDTPPLLYTTTDLDGHYQFAGLVDGTYLVRYLDPTGVYANGYYHSRFPSQGADTVVLADGRTQQPIDQQMVKAGVIRGSVRDGRGRSVAGAAVGYRTELNSFVNIKNFTTAADGQYTMTGIAPGVYYVCAFSPTAPLVGEVCFGGSPDYWSGVPVPVSGGKETIGIDIVLGPQPEWERLYLPFVQP